MPLQPSLNWHAPALQHTLAQQCPGLQVDVAAQLGSTNTELLARCRQQLDAQRLAPDAHPPLPASLLVAEVQTQGRGRQGKTWFAAAGASLTFSLGLVLAPHNWSGLSLAVGLAIADVFDPPQAGQAPRLGLKWPNDVLLVDARCVGRKLGGILIETLATPAGRLAVVGVGLNLQPVATPADAAPAPWGQAHLAELWPGLDAPAALARLAPALLRTLLDFETQGFAPLAARYSQRDLLHGLAVHTSLPELPDGVADGVDPSGMLWLRRGTQRFAVGSGEVSLRRAPTAQAPC